MKKRKQEVHLRVFQDAVPVRHDAAKEEAKHAEQEAPRQPGQGGKDRQVADSSHQAHNAAKQEAKDEEKTKALKSKHMMPTPHFSPSSWIASCVNLGQTTVNPTLGDMYTTESPNFMKKCHAAFKSLNWSEKQEYLGSPARFEEAVMSRVLEDFGDF